MDIHNKLFHGINLSNYEYSIDFLSDTDVLEQIFDSKKICNRYELYKNNRQLYVLLNHVYNQLDHQVCLSIHPNNTNYSEDSFRTSIFKYESAYYEFIRYKISLILTETLITETNHKIAGMYGEIRVNNSISLTDNLVAIGYYDEIEDVINTLEQILKKEDEIEYKTIRFQRAIHGFMYAENLEEYVTDKKQKYFEIKNLLEKYNFLVQIVDSYSGQLIEENLQLQIEKSMEIREKIKKMMRL